MNNREINTTEIWNEEKRKSLREFIEAQSVQQDSDRQLKNELLSIKYQIEDYIESDDTIEPRRIIDFVKMYLKVFNVTQKRLADLFEMKDSNLHKYLVGERKLNTDLILKLSSFSNLNPEHWLKIEVKNELMEINREKRQNKNYNKYDYRMLLTRV